MGCEQTKGTVQRKSICGSTPGKDIKVTVQLIHPHTQQIQEITQIVSVRRKSEDTLLDIMNNIFFLDEKNKSVDVCFHSLYNKSDDRFHYYLSRLMEIEMENMQEPYLGRMWVLYIHNKPYDWDAIVNSQMKFNYLNGGKLVWRFERLMQLSKVPHVWHEQSQTNNLAYIDFLYGQPRTQTDLGDARSLLMQKSGRLLRPSTNSERAKTIVAHVDPNIRLDMLGELQMLNLDLLQIEKQGENHTNIYSSSHFLQTSPINFNQSGFRGIRNQKKRFTTNLIREVYNTEEDNNIPPPLHTERAEMVESKLYTIETQPNDELTRGHSSMLLSVGKERYNGMKSLPNLGKA